MRAKTADIRPARERFACDLLAAKYLRRTRARRLLRRSLSPALALMAVWTWTCWVLGGCAGVTMPRPVPAGYVVKDDPQWVCMFKKRTPHSETLWFAPRGTKEGWTCELDLPMSSGEECLCGDTLCMCEGAEQKPTKLAVGSVEIREPNITEPTAEDCVTEGDNSPNIIGNLGTIVIDGTDESSTFTGTLYGERSEITKEEHSLFLEENICPICKREDKRSRVYCEGGFVTAMSCGNGYYDEEGEYYPPPRCNTFTYGCHCSNKHWWAMSVLR